MRFYFSARRRVRGLSGIVSCIGQLRTERVAHLAFTIAPSGAELVNDPHQQCRIKSLMITRERTPIRMSLHTLWPLAGERSGQYEDEYEDLQNHRRGHQESEIHGRRCRKKGERVGHGNQHKPAQCVAFAPHPDE